MQIYSAILDSGNSMKSKELPTNYNYPTNWTLWNMAMMLLIVMEWLRLRCVVADSPFTDGRWYIIMSWRREGEEVALIVLISNSILFFLSAYTRCLVQVFPLDYILHGGIG